MFFTCGLLINQFTKSATQRQHRRNTDQLVTSAVQLDWLHETLVPGHFSWPSNVWRLKVLTCETAWFVTRRRSDARKQRTGGRLLAQRLVKKISLCPMSQANRRIWRGVSMLFSNLGWMKEYVHRSTRRPSIKSSSARRPYLSLGLIAWNAALEIVQVDLSSAHEYTTRNKIAPCKSMPLLVFVGSFREYSTGLGETGHWLNKELPCGKWRTVSRRWGTT